MVVAGADESSRLAKAGESRTLGEVAPEPSGEGENEEEEEAHDEGRLSDRCMGSTSSPIDGEGGLVTCRAAAFCAARHAPS